MALAGRFELLLQCRRGESLRVGSESLSYFYFPRPISRADSVLPQTSPSYTYFLLTLPKLLLLALPFAFFSLFLDRRARRIGVPAIVFIAILSGLEHKEWRFISYVVPVLNICAASGLRAIGALYALLLSSARSPLQIGMLTKHDRQIRFEKVATSLPGCYRLRQPCLHTTRSCRKSRQLRWRISRREAWGSLEAR